jgi:hypothetical protein
MSTAQVVSPNHRRFARAAVGLVAAWVLAGAGFKFFKGTPALLPESVRDFGDALGLELGVVYKLAIGIELAIVAFALLRPRWGWLLQAALLLVFDLVLTLQIQKGAENCGCFGSALEVPPKLMLTIDSVLLALLALSRPWRLASGGSPTIPLAAGAIGLALPWLYDRQIQPGQVVENGQPVAGQWLQLELEEWVGKEIWDTPLGTAPLNQYIDVSSLPLDGLWVFWRADCDHCAKHLAALAETEKGERLITLVRLEQATDTEGNRVVHAMPSGNFVQQATLPAGISYILQTPGELLLEGGRITAALEGVTEENSLARH